MPSYFLSQKLWNCVALLIFAVVMGGLLLILPEPGLDGPVTDFYGVLANVLSHSAGPPFFLVTVCLLCLLPMIMRLPKKTALRLWIQFGLLLVLSFFAKTALKHITEVPRPYSYELQRLHLVKSPQAFYTMNTMEKNSVAEKAAAFVSHWRIPHWKGETNYSFPSGHTIFAAVCVVFWGGFFLRRRKYLPAVTLIAWATGVGVSRIWLGMHWPSDIIASIACAGGLYLLIPEQRAALVEPVDQMVLD